MQGEQSRRTFSLLPGGVIHILAGRKCPGIDTDKHLATTGFQTDLEGQGGQGSFGIGFEGFFRLGRGIDASHCSAIERRREKRQYAVDKRLHTDIFKR